MAIVELSSRLTKVQNALFEKAHTEPCEVKHIAIALKKQGIKGDKLFLHPEMFPLPMIQCPELQKLTHKQKVILSACSFANMYKMVGRSEHQAIDSNMVTAEKAFSRYSDEYMILAQETSEEYDHIWSFRTVHSMACKETGIAEKFTNNELGFFSGELSSRPKTVPLSNRTIQFAIGDGMRFLPNNFAQSAGLGALWLLYRFIGNVYLKQAEAYLHDNLGDYSYEPLAVEMTKAHLVDEARHYTTSYDIGLEIYQAADPWGQKIIKTLLKGLLEDFIRRFYVTFNEMLALHEQGTTSTAIRQAIQTMKMAFNHPEFRDIDLDPESLPHTWYLSGFGQELGPIIKKRWRYTSQQLERLIEALDIQLDIERMGQGYERYQSALNFSLPDKEPTVA